MMAILSGLKIEGQKPNRLESGKVVLNKDKIKGIEQGLERGRNHICAYVISFCCE
jgi:hypothetical protein